MENIIVVKDLKRLFGENIAVNSINFNVRKGDIFGFLGKNGAGKSTTIKMLTGMLKPTSGYILIDNLDPINEQKKLARKIGLVPEELSLYIDMSIKQNLNFFAKLYNADKENVNCIISKLELKEHEGKQIRKLSKGYKQRVLIARALLHDPEVIFMDEPTSGLDPDIAQSIRKLILDLKNEGKTIFLTTHNMAEAESLCDYVTFINKGYIIESGNPDKLKLKYGNSNIKITRNNTIKIYDAKNKQEINQQIDIGFDTIHSCESTLDDVFIKIMGEEDKTNVIKRT